MRRVRSQFLQAAVGRLGFAVRGLGVSGGAVVAPCGVGTGAPSCGADGALGARAARLVVLVVALVAALALQVSAAEAQTADREVLLSFGTETGVLGGQVGFGVGVAVNGAGVGGGEVGDVYVGNYNNRRVEVFSRLGEFRRAFGFDVVASGPHNDGANEQQSVTLPGGTAGGTFQLRYGGTNAAATSAAIAFDASAAQVQTALEGVANIGAGNVSVAGPAGGPYVVTFQGALGGNDAAQMTAVGALTPAGTVAIATTTNGGGVETCYPDDVCKVGLNTAVAGTVGNAEGLGFDPATGNLFVADQQNRRVVVYGADGGFQGAFGWNVNAASPAAQLQFCTTATGCQQGTSTAGAGGFASLVSTGFAVDPDSGNLLVAERGNRRVNEFALTLDGNDRVTGVSFVRAFGWDVVSSGPGNRTVDRDEQQSIRLAGAFDLGCLCVAPVSAGTFTLSFDPDAAGPAPAETTTAIPYDASAAVVEQRLVDDLASVASGDIEISGGPGPGTAWTADFAGAYAGTNVAQITGSGTGLTPAGSNVTVSTTVAGGTFPAGFEVCVGADGDVCQASTAGTGDGQFPTNTPTDVAVDDDGAIYVASGTRVQVFNPDASFREVFGPSTGDCPVNGTSVSGVTIDPDTQNLFVTQKPTTTSYRLCEFMPNGTLVDASPTTPVTTNATGYLYIARDGIRTYVNTPLAGTGGPTAIHLLAEIPSAPEVVMDPVGLGGIGTTSATFEGTVTIPDSAVPVTTNYRFEYTSDGVTWRRAPVPADGIVGDGNPGDFDVTQTVGGLRPNTAYQVRLRASSPGGENTSTPVVFTTDPAPPTIVASYVEDLQDTSVRLRGTVDPHGLQTDYHFEYGIDPDELTGRIPVPDRDIGSGNVAVAVWEAIGDLEPATTYYFQLVAISDAGTTAGPQRSFATRGAPLAPRGVELVSHPDDGGVGFTKSFLVKGTNFQVAPSGDDVLYPYSYGNDDSIAPGYIKMFGRRGSTGWAREDALPPYTEEIIPSHTGGPGYIPGDIIYTTEDLSCSLVASPQQLTPDASTVPRDNDGGNLFLSDSDGEYTLLTEDVPTNVAAGVGTPLHGTTMRLNLGGFRAGRVSSDCERVVFESYYRYPGLNNTATYVGNNAAIYVWEDGELRDVSRLPDGSPAQRPTIGDSAGAGSAPAAGMSLNAVSDDGGRVYFTAVSNSGADSGRRAVFLREGDETVKVSESETAVATQDAVYEVASVSGDRVAFSANYGLTSPSSTGPTATGNDCREGLGQSPCALYVYDAGSGSLTDISATSDPANEAGAAVAGVMAASDDLQRIYFAARGQLVEHEGRSYADNVAVGSLNVYLYDHGDLAHVGVITTATLGRDRPLLKGAAGGLQSATTPDGAHLVFLSRAKLTPDGTAGVPLVYRYDAEAGELVCVSCRRDGQPPIVSTTPTFSQFQQDLANEVSVPRMPRGVSDDGSRIAFRSLDALTPGAVDGKTNVYVWDRGAIQLLTVGELENELSNAIEISNQREPRIIGMSASGDDVFVNTPESLVGEDGDGVMDLYDFRVGGGFPTPAVKEPCDALGGRCQGGGAAPTGSRVASDDLSDGNVVSGARQRLGLGRLSLAQRRTAARSGVLSVRVRTTRAGRVRAVARGRIGKRTRRVAARSVRVRKAGRVTLKLRFNQVARKRLRQGRALKLSVRVVSPGARSRSMTVRLPGVRS